jgi:hypothetical protein
VLLAAILVIAAGGIAVRLITESVRSCQQTLIPAYFYPGANWTEAIDSKPPPQIMIFDITSSGAGSAPDRNYQAAVSRARAAGITLAGYASTNYARRPASAVETDVSHYKSWYGVTDIFLDQVSSTGGDLSYYRRLSDYIHGTNPGSLVILNPGTYPDEAYMSIGDVVMVFEDSYANYVKLDVPKWVDNYPPSKFSYVIYGVSSSQLAGVISMSKRRHAGYIYVTPNTGVNPYISLPSYWASEDAIIAACTELPAGRAQNYLPAVRGITYRLCAGLPTGRGYAARRGPG